MEIDVPKYDRNIGLQNYREGMNQRKKIGDFFVGVIVTLFLAVLAIPMKANDNCRQDTLKYDYESLYAVHWDMTACPVANVFTFLQNDVDRIVEALLDTPKEALFQGNWILCYYLDTSFEEISQIKSNLSSIDLPHGYEWKFGLFENDKQGLALLAAIVESDYKFVAHIGHACIDKDPSGRPVISFSLYQGESDDLSMEFRKFRVKHNCILLTINDWAFAPTQMKQLDAPSNDYITISYVPDVVIQDLYSTSVRYMLENVMPNEAVRPAPIKQQP